MTAKTALTRAVQVSAVATGGLNAGYATAVGDHAVAAAATAVTAALVVGAQLALRNRIGGSA